MAQQDKATYKTNKNLLLADNTSRDISEADLRTLFENMVDSFLNKTDELREPVKAYTATHSSNAYTVTADNFPAYATNIPLIIKPSATNSGSAPTINVNGLGAKTWKKADGTTDYVASDISSDEYYLVVYNGTNYITLTGADVTSGSPAGSDGDIQYKSGSSFAAESDFNYDAASNLLAVNQIWRNDTAQQLTIGGGIPASGSKIVLSGFTGTDPRDLKIYAGSGTTGRIAFYDHNGDLSAYVDENTEAGNWDFQSNDIRRVNTLELIDGVTAPSNLAGRARIYVDSSDGDLKIIFGDGTVKTIVTDT